jgi:hypothetical protein
MKSKISIKIFLGLEVLRKNDFCGFMHLMDVG